MHPIIWAILLYKFVINTLLHNPNQFAAGGMVLMVLGSIGAVLRNIPGRIWDWIVHQTTITMTITDEQKAYRWVKLWMETRPATKRIRHLDVQNRGSEKYMIIPGPGHHWMLYNKRLLSVMFSRTEEKKMAEVYGGTSRSESVLFKTIGRNTKIFNVMMKEINEYSIEQEEKKPELYNWGSWGEWSEVHSFQPRPIESVILSKSIKDRVIKEVENFRNSREWFGKMGIPYRKGLLFHGPPGTGKTSLVAGLASYFNANVYLMKLNDMSDATLFQAATSVQANSFIIIEDIDCVSATQTREIKTPTLAKVAENTYVKGKDKVSSGVTLSGLLNVLDGLLSPTGAVFIITTNHIEELDPALIRPGRVDLKIFIGMAEPEQKQELYNRFFPGECPEKYLNQEMTMADLQQKLMGEALEKA